MPVVMEGAWYFLVCSMPLTSVVELNEERAATHRGDNSLLEDAA